jgi:hypothetical protein
MAINTPIHSNSRKVFMADALGRTLADLRNQR